MKFNTKSILYSTFIMAVANFVVRIMGFAYRIFLSRTIGPLGMGIYQMVFPVYSLAITLTATGIPVAVSRIVAQRSAVNDGKGVRRVMYLCILITIIFSAAISLFMLRNTDFISTVILKEPRTASSLMVIFPCIIITSLLEIFKCYFYGVKNVHPSAAAEIIEQLVRMSLVIFLLGKYSPLSYEMSSVVAICGMIFGELISLVYIYFNYKKSIKYYFRPRQTPNVFKLLSQITQITIPLTITRLISTAINTSNSILIPQRLMVSGMSNADALGLFGMVSGMAMPVLFLPFTLISALSVVIIPNLSESLELKNWKSIRDKTSKTILITCVAALCCMSVLIPLGYPIGIALYNQKQVGTVLVPLSCALLFNSLQSSLSSILNGMGKQNRAAVHFIIGGIVQILFTYFGVARPGVGIQGFIAGFFVNTLLVCVLNFILVIKTTMLKVDFIGFFLKPAVAAIATGMLNRIMFMYVLNSGASYWMSLAAVIPVGVLIFMAINMALGVMGNPVGILNRRMLKR